MTTLLFLAAVLVAPLAFALPVLRLRSLSHLDLPARAAIGWAGGTLVLSVVLTILAGFGIAWRPWLVMTLAVFPVAIAWRLPAARQPSVSTVPRIDRTSRAIAAVCTVTIAGAGLVQFAAGGATSADLSYFWGVKAVRFALDRGMDFQWLGLPHLAHLHPNYPPLWPVSLGWGTLMAGAMPWQTVPVVSWVYVATTGLIVHSLLLRPLGYRGATMVACLWFAVLSGSTVRSFSGGNAEGPLLLFITAAVTTLVIENSDQAPNLRWLAAGALAGAVLTKSEGGVAAAIIVAGTVIRDIVWKNRGVLRRTMQLVTPMLAAAGLWAAIKIAHGLPLTDPIRETAFLVSFSHLGLVFKVCARLFGAGVLWVGWLVPLISAAMTRPVLPSRVLPGLLVAIGLPVFALIYYLHAPGDPVELIAWTFPRLIQPAISAWIVSLGVICFGNRTGRLLV
jgi:hypothetical protein